MMSRTIYATSTHDVGPGRRIVSRSNLYRSWNLVNHEY